MAQCYLLSMSLAIALILGAMLLIFIHNPILSPVIRRLRTRSVDADEEKKGNTEEPKTINYFLDERIKKVSIYQWGIFREGFPLTVEAFRKKWFGLRGLFLYLKYCKVYLRGSEMQ